MNEFDENTLIDLMKKLSVIPQGPYYYFTSGSPISDEATIEYFKDEYVIVVDRDRRQWFHGKPVIMEGSIH